MSVISNLIYIDIFTINILINFILLELLSIYVYTYYISKIHIVIILMQKNNITSTDIKKIYRFDDRNKSIQAVYSAEEKGEIPSATRVNRGKVSVRNWLYQDLPIIGKKFGYIREPKSQKVITKYIQKGGVLKTTTTFNEAMVFALNGLNTLIIGQDFECSITDIIIPQGNINSIDEGKQNLGLYHHLVEGADIQDVIQPTALPTLDIIPETHDLVILDKWINQQKRREYLYKDKLIPKLSNYDVIIFDNNPSWNHLTENSIVASDAIISPLGCNLLAYNAAETNMATIYDFQEAMGLNTQVHVMFPTLLENTSLSKQIYAQYISKFPDIITTPIKSAIKFQEALVMCQSIIEYAPSSSNSQDYYDLICDIWEKILTQEN